MRRLNDAKKSRLRYSGKVLGVRSSFAFFWSKRLTIRTGKAVVTGCSQDAGTAAAGAQAHVFVQVLDDSRCVTLNLNSTTWRAHRLFSVVHVRTSRLPCSCPLSFSVLLPPTIHPGQHTLLWHSGNGDLLSTSGQTQPIISVSSPSSHF